MATLREEIVWRGDQLSSELWVDEDVGDGWQVSFKLVFQSYRFVIGEERITPLPERPGLDPQDREGQVPRGGLTARIHRRARFEATREVARKALDIQLAKFPDPDEAYLRHFLAEHEVVSRGLQERKTRGSWSDVRYIRVAARYAEMVRDGTSRPVARLAFDERVSESRIRQALKHARDKGWLTPTSRRQAGGALTDAALDLLKMEGNDG